MQKVPLVVVFFTFLTLLLASAASAVAPVTCGSCDGGGGMPACTAATVGWQFNLAGTWYTCARTMYRDYRWIYS